ncbi:MAG: hypothetical protein ACH350_00865 [Parachlamydiaceae bacterium]
MDTVEKFYKKEAKNSGFSKSMKCPKKSNESILDKRDVYLQDLFLT